MFKIRLIGDPVLRQETQSISNFDEKLKKTIDQMIDAMHREDGIGLAAPQVGISDKLLVVDVSGIEGEESKPQAFINPEIIAMEGESVIEEGCLSIPGVKEEVKRPETITLVYNDENGEKREDSFSGWMARVLQHEIDHLNGILFIDHISPVKKQMLISQEAIPSVF